MFNKFVDSLKKYVTWPVAGGIVAVVIAGLAFWLIPDRSEPEELTLSEFQEEVADGGIKDAKLGNRSNEVSGELENGNEYIAVVPTEFTDELTEILLAVDVPTEVDNEDSGFFSSFLSDFLPTLLIIGVFLWFVLQMQGGGKKNIGQLNTKKSKQSTDVTFADVAGADEALEELKEIKNFLEDPERFSSLGAKIPTGVLLVGPPGTGKTLLAKAVAGEAGVPFFTISGSDFVEMFVGVGAARVRDLFKQAKALAPAIVFVDEIDAVGRHRGTGVGGGHDEREQTLNQLLVEMDGFGSNDGVILMAATNRPDVLDPALLRPGRFDRQIVVDAPDRTGREAILDVHAKNKSLDSSVDLSVLARRTPGFTGADLANVINEAALLAGRYEAESISMDHVNEAIDRVMAGPERKSRVMTETEKRVTAYHEGGHALAGHLLEDSDPIHKVSIVARGRALGWTLSLPLEDRHTHSRKQLESRLVMLMGGRTAEQLVFGEVTTGAVDDIEQATRLARSMVTEFGMSDALGAQRLSAGDDEPFLGRDRTGRTEYSDSVAAQVDKEVKALIDEAEQRAAELLTNHRATLDALASELIVKETLDEDELNQIFEGDHS